MKLLLDTHIWLWSLLEPNRLSPRIRRELQSERNELWLSAISTWEVVMLEKKGRISLEPDVEAWIKGAQLKAPLLEASLTHEISVATRSVHLPHRDPADYFIVATAKVLGLTLVTADRQLLKCKDILLLGT